MNSMPGVGPGVPGSQQIRPARTWYVLAVAILLAGFVAAGFLIWRAASGFTTPVGELHAYETKNVTLEDEGLAIYATGGDYRGACTVRDFAGRPVVVEPPTGRQTMTINGRQWVLVAWTPEEIPAGTYVVGCESDDDQTMFGVGPYLLAGGTVVLIFSAVGVAGLALIVAGVLALVIFLRRRAGRQRMQGPGGYGPGYTQPNQW